MTPSLSLSNFFFISLLIFTFFTTKAQEPALYIMRPDNDTIHTTHSRNFISGNTCPSCQHTINQTPVKVWPTSAFAHSLDLNPDDTFILLRSTDSRVQSTEIILHYRLTIPK